MAHSNGDLLQVFPTKIAHESLPFGFVEEEATTHQAFTIGGDDER
jgi:hypothetical protein